MVPTWPHTCLQAPGHCLIACHCCSLLASRCCCLLNCSHKGLWIKTSTFQSQRYRPPGPGKFWGGGDFPEHLHTPNSCALSGFWFPLDWVLFFWAPRQFLPQTRWKVPAIHPAALPPSTGISISGFISSQDSGGSLRWVSMSTFTEIQTFGFLKGSLTSATTSLEWQRVFFKA